MNEKYLNVDLDDPKIGTIADVISNKTSKKILGLLAEREMTESEISKELKVPLNTIGYSISKLQEVGLIEKVSSFLWSVKGKRIHRYRLSNKKIIISPKSSINGILSTILITGVIAAGIKFFSTKGSMALEGPRLDAPQMMESFSTTSAKIGGVADSGVYYAIQNASNTWAWFFIGALTALLVFLLLNWRKK